LIILFFKHILSGGQREERERKGIEKERRNRKRRGGEKETGQKDRERER
jgi:hypothetical protein